jgi:hypothetical protein
MYSSLLEEDHIRVNAIRIILKQAHWWNPWETISAIRQIINCASFPGFNEDLLACPWAADGFLAEALVKKGIAIGKVDELLVVHN